MGAKQVVRELQCGFEDLKKHDQVAYNKLVQPQIDQLLKTDPTVGVRAVQSLYDWESPAAQLMNRLLSMVPDVNDASRLHILSILEKCEDRKDRRQQMVKIICSLANTPNDSSLSSISLYVLTNYLEVMTGKELFPVKKRIAKLLIKTSDKSGYEMRKGLEILESIQKEDLQQVSNDQQLCRELIGSAIGHLKGSRAEVGLEILEWVGRIRPQAFKDYPKLAQQLPQSGRWPGQLKGIYSELITLGIGIQEATSWANQMLKSELYAASLYAQELLNELKALS